MGAGKWPRILQLGYNIYSLSGRIFALVFVSGDFEVGSKVGVDRQSRTGLIFKIQFLLLIVRWKQSLRPFEHPSLQMFFR